MIALINGAEGATLKLFKGGYTMLRVHNMSDGEEGPTGQVSAIGTPLDVTGDTLTLEIYDTADRRNAAVKSITITVGAGAVYGYSVCTIVAASIDFGPGTYYGYVKRIENTGTTTEYSRTHCVIQVT